MTISINVGHDSSPPDCEIGSDQLKPNAPTCTARRCRLGSGRD
jgi:hypothetical protein